MSTLTNDLARLANSANVLVSAITVNSSAITSVNVGIVNSTTLSVGTSVVANSSRLVIGNGVGLQANGNIGAAGQVLTSNATTIYWSTPSFGGGSITAVIAGDGLTGGGTSGNVTLDVVSGNGISVSADAIAVIANSGLLANSTGVHVNSTYIGTLSANNASFLGGTAAASYQLNSTLNANIASYLPTYAGVVNGASYTVGTAFTANSTMTNTVSLVVSTNTATIGTTFYSVANGNVGIGTTSPTSRLHVVGGTANALRVEGGADSTIRNSANTGSSWFVGTNINSYILHNESNTPMTFTTNGTERMRIGPTGDVFIGTQTDAGNTLRYFDVQNANTGSSAGAIIRLITSNSAGTGVTTADIVKYKNGNFVINNNDPSGTTFFNNAGAERMRIDSAGRITTPFQPMFSAWNQHTTTAGVVTNVWASWNSNITNWATPRWFVNTNIGSSFNSSNGVFTAPISGYYWVSIGMTGDFRNSAYLGFWVNGALASPLSITYEYDASINSGIPFYNQLSQSFIFNLAANDTITGGCYFAAPGTGTTTIIRDGYTFIAGYLLG